MQSCGDGKRGVDPGAHRDEAEGLETGTQAHQPPGGYLWLSIPAPISAPSKPPSQSKGIFYDSLHPGSPPNPLPGQATCPTLTPISWDEARSPHYPEAPASKVALGVKSLPADAGDVRDAGSIPESGRSPGGGHGNPSQYPCLGNPMDKGAWQTTVHGVAKGRT